MTRPKHERKKKKTINGQEDREFLPGEAKSGGGGRE